MDDDLGPVACRQIYNVFRKARPGVHNHKHQMHKLAALSDRPLDTRFEDCVSSCGLAAALSYGLEGTSVQAQKYAKVDFDDRRF